MKRFVIPLLSLILLLGACSRPVTPSLHTLPAPALEPDYAGVTFPVNIAAPTFMITDSASAWQTQIGRCGADPEITVSSGADGAVTIPLKAWKKLLASAAGDSIYLRFAARTASGEWNQAPDIICPVSADSIDRYLTYRLLYPGYELWSAIGIYERDLESYVQKPILENKDFDSQCINCHNYAANDPTKGMMVHVRGKDGGTLIARNGKVEKISSSFQGANHGATYPSWSRDGRFIAFSANQIGQTFHSAGSKPIEVIDQAADLMVYDVENHKAYSADTLTGTHAIETFPNWSPDGRTLYFCRAFVSYPEMAEQHADSVHYDLCAIDFNPANGQFSNFRTLYDAAADSASVSFPRVSPDGNWLMFTRMVYGNFSIWHPESQLCILNLRTGQWRELSEVNSPDAVDSYHCWGSSGRWFVFSSKRLDGLWARPFIASFDPQTGRATKPFALPQKKPEFYRTFTKTFNIPELIQNPASANASELLNAIHSQQPQAITLTK
ncbi:MAG: cytochrome C biosynthesis protein [Muribaculaceae bacterium]|nr:cytochrome C biosynthesis protein [Muribaculaceae bacterium]